MPHAMAILKCYKRNAMTFCNMNGKNGENKFSKSVIKYLLEAFSPFGLKLYD